MEKKMKRKNLLHIIAVWVFIAFIVLGLACCASFFNILFNKSDNNEQPDNNPQVNGAEELKDYLNEQTDNSLDRPISVTVTVNDQTIKDTMDVIKSSGKYVSIRFSSSELTTFPADTFTNCANLTSITLPNSVTSIKDNAFNGCTNLTEINLGSNIASLSYNAFNNCPSLISINVDSRNQNYSSGSVMQANGVLSHPLYNKNRTMIIRVPEGYKGNFIIPDSVEVIAPYCFYQTGITITEITIYADIGPYAFYGTSITYLTLGGGGFNTRTGKVEIQRVYENAFINCTSLVSVRFDGLIQLDKGSFDGDLYDVWDKATTLKFSNGVTGRDSSFKGTYIRRNGMTWTRSTGR